MAAVFCGSLLKSSYPSPCLSPSPYSSTSRKAHHHVRLGSVVRAVQSAEPEKAKAKTPPKKPVYSMKKGQIVRVEKDKYLNSVNYLSVGHPPYYKGLDYIYEDRGEVLDLRIFETGEYALVAWVGVPTAPAWLPTNMLIKSDKLDYERL
ncbi:NAD(P)H:plastoquinone dehydrogenase complex subunit O [Euphorbia peplus]|nr:NAD(P)H:plastoquinone dehydrogenase complex subunit O [Euphorbia peplus]